MKVTFIGLGIMGSRMAANLIKNNIELTVFNRTKEAMSNLIGLGAKGSKTLSDAVQDADIVISMLSTPEVVKSVFVQQDKVLESMKESALWIDCSTVNPSFSREMSMLAELFNIRHLDAPVAGTKPHAEKAELTFFVGGDKAYLEEAQVLLDLMGQKVLHLGPSGQGSSFKMLVNVMLAQSMLIFSESVILGEKLGLDKSFLLNTLPNLIVSAPFTKFKAGMIAEEKYDVQFPLEWMYKDLHLVTQTAYEHSQPLYLANLTKEVYADAVQKGYGRLDFSAIHKSLEN